MDVNSGIGTHGHCPTLPGCGALRPEFQGHAAVEIAVAVYLPENPEVVVRGVRLDGTGCDGIAWSSSTYPAGLSDYY